VKVARAGNRSARLESWQETEAPSTRPGVVPTPARHGTLPTVDEASASLPPEALQYYARGQEAVRLAQGQGLLEFARTCEILEGWALPDLAARWADPARRRDILVAARAVESEPSLLGVNAHLLAVGRVPAG
jgi:hypothetical protein